MPSCTGCGQCCTVVRGRPDEIKRIRHFMRDNDVEWVVPPEDDQLRCGFLRDQPDGTKTCGVYEARPWACRAFGVIKEMPCTFFFEAATISLPADEAIARRLSDPDDQLLGEAFEGPGYAERLAAYMAKETGREDLLRPGIGAELLAQQRRERAPLYADGSPRLEFK